MVQINEEGGNFDLPEKLEKHRLDQIKLKNKLHERGYVVARDKFHIFLIYFL